MNPILVAGTRIVVLALLSYSIAIFIEQKRRLVRGSVLVFLTIGVILDITATALMINGSQNTPFTLHGVLGYSALAAMLTDTVLIWRFRLANGADATVPGKLHLFSRFAYIWWVVAFVTGSALVFLK